MEIVRKNFEICQFPQEHMSLALLLTKDNICAGTALNNFNSKRPDLLAIALIKLDMLQITGYDIWQLYKHTHKMDTNAFYKDIMLRNCPNPGFVTF